METICRPDNPCLALLTYLLQSHLSFGQLLIGYRSTFCHYFTNSIKAEQTTDQIVLHKDQYILEKMWCN